MASKDIIDIAPAASPPTPPRDAGRRGPRGALGTHSTLSRWPSAWVGMLPVVLLRLLAAAPADTTPARPWFNASLPLETRLSALVDAMTADEIITQLVKYSQRIDRLGVPAYAWHMEAAHGVTTGGDSTVFPCSLARAASWDTELEGKVARATGVEARAKWNGYLKLHGEPPPYNAEGLSLTLYAPEINICRDPRWFAPTPPHPTPHPHPACWRLTAGVATGAAARNRGARIHT